MCRSVSVLYVKILSSHFDFYYIITHSIIVDIEKELSNGRVKVKSTKQPPLLPDRLKEGCLFDAQRGE